MDKRSRWRKHYCVQRSKNLKNLQKIVGMKNVLKNWKTTLSGILYVASALVPVQYQELVKGIAVLLLGSAATDSSNSSTPLN